MHRFFQQLSQALSSGPLALATVVDARGSTPRVAGARQFFTSAGLSEGTVGGGVAEARVEELAKATLADGLPRTFEADMRGRPGDTRDGVCGGAMTVWIVRLEPTASLPALRALTQSLQAGRKAVLGLRLRSDEPIVVTTLDEAASSSPEQFTEIIQPPPRLLIVGAGHIGRSLAHLMDRLGFAIMVQDNRPEWLVPEAFPACCERQLSLDEAGGVLRDWEGGRFIALVTRGFPQDVEALKILSTVPDLDYLGILGSKPRVATVFGAAREAGLQVPPSATLRAPIGIEIGAETPDEIAVSIAAEIIQVWRRGSGSTARPIS